MKALAVRAVRDVDDIRVLLNYLGVSTTERGLSVFQHLTNRLLQGRLTSSRDTPESCQSSPACSVNFRCISTSGGVFGPPTGLESKTAEGSATSNDRNRLRRRSPTLTHVRQLAS
jgi:hypothetical protein